MFKETEQFNPLYVAKLENGVVLFVYDGYAKGSDGRLYKPVIVEDEDEECEVIGWEPQTE